MYTATNSTLTRYPAAMATSTAGARMYQGDWSAAKEWNRYAWTNTDMATWDLMNTAFSRESCRFSSRGSNEPTRATSMATGGLYSTATARTIGKLRLSSIPPLISTG